MSDPQAGARKTLQERLAHVTRKFVIVTAQRSASTYLGASLHEHPDIFCHGEVFNPTRVEMRWFGKNSRPPVGERAKALETLRQRNPEAFLNRVFALNDGEHIVGFKLFDVHDLARRDAILADPSIAKIVLRRSNTLARYASRNIAWLTGDWKTGAADKPLVKFDPADFQRFHDDQLNYYESVRAALEGGGQQSVWIEYADAGSFSTLGRICAFLGTSPPSEGMMIRESRPGSADILSRFSNSAAVAKYLSENGLEELATEELRGTGSLS